LGIYICASILAYPAGALRIDDFFAPTVLMIGIFNVLAVGYDRAMASQRAKHPAKRAMGNINPASIPAPSAAPL
jgi:hypothetical protein